MADRDEQCPEPPALPDSRNTAPVTFGQLWMLRRMVYDSHISEMAIAEANVDVVWPLPAGIDVAAVRQAWERLVRHNDSLRTVFDWNRPHPVQTVRARCIAHIGVVDLPDDSMAQAEAVAFELAQRTIAVEREPPWLAMITTHRNEPRFLALAIHHVAADHTSTALLREQFDRFLAGQRVAPHLRPIDIAIEQRTAREQHQETLDYWTDQWADLADEDRAGNDRTPRVEGSIFSNSGATAAQHIGTRLGISLHAVALGVSYLVLTRQLERSRATLALMSSNRFEERDESLISSMIQIAPLTATVDQNMGVDDFLLDIYLRSIEAYGHGSYDIDALRDHLASSGFANPDPMAFDCYFNFVYGLPSTPASDEPAVVAIEWTRPRRRTGPRFMLAIAAEPDGIVASLRASHSYLTPVQVAEFLGSFEAALVDIDKHAPELIADIGLKPIRPIPTPG